MAILHSEREVTCPCCGATLVVDINLGRVISHQDPPSAHGVKPIYYRGRDRWMPLPAEFGRPRRGEPLA